jgi:EmrB/QacA subfamily drug resistance transporter
MSEDRPGWLRHSIFVLTAFGVLMASIDGTIMIVALPQLTESLNTTLSWVGWTLTSYSLVQIVMFPLAGKLSDVLGRRRVFLFSVITFTVASLLCALAPNVGTLIVLRALQAIGGGGLVPSAISLLADEYRRHRAQAIGLISSVMPIGSIVGPNLGGILLEAWGWRAMFLINLPIGVLLVAGFWLLANGGAREETKGRLSVDVRGLALFTGSIVALMVGTTVIADAPALAGNPLVWLLFVASVVLAGLFLRHARLTPDAVMDYRLLAKSPFLAANIYNFVLGAVTMGFYSFVPYYAVVKYGLTPFESGAVLTPRAVLVVLVSTFTSFLLKRLGYRWPMLIGQALVAINLLLLGQGWTSATFGPVVLNGFWLMALIISLGGIGMGLANPSSNNAAIELAPEQAGAITGIRGTFRLAGGSIAISCIVLVLSFFQDQAAGMDLMFLVFTGLLVVSVPLVLMIPEPHHAPTRTPTVVPPAPEPAPPAASSVPVRRS